MLQEHNDDEEHGQCVEGHNEKNMNTMGVKKGMNTMGVKKVTNTMCERDIMDTI
jgi:hypothetical protein